MDTPQKNTGAAYHPASVELERSFANWNDWDKPPQVPHTLEQLIEKHAAATARWQTSEYRPRIDELFEKGILRQSFIINQAICVALGSFTQRSDDRPRLTPKQRRMQEVGVEVS